MRHPENSDHPLHIAPKTRIEINAENSRQNPNREKNQHGQIQKSPCFAKASQGAPQPPFIKGG